jgi:hypothetical protein
MQDLGGSICGEYDSLRLGVGVRLVGFCGLKGQLTVNRLFRRVMVRSREESCRLTVRMILHDCFLMTYSFISSFGSSDTR